MVLMRFWSSLPNILKFNSDNMTREDGEVIYSRRGLQMFLADSPMYSSHSTLSHLYLYMTQLFTDWIFILWSHEEVLDGGSSFNMYLYAIYLANSFEAFTQPLMVW